MRIHRDKIKRQKRKLVRMKERMDNNEITIDSVRSSFQSWQANAERGNTRNQIFKLRQFYFKLFNEEAPYGKKYYRRKRICESIGDCRFNPFLAR